MNVLIIDDELVVCQSCAKVINKRGHNTKYSVSGREALKLIEKEPFDIVFSDLKMMDLGGMEVLKYLKENRPDIVSVIITGYATIASAVETMKLGAFDYLPKPFTSDELSAVLQKAVQKRELILENMKMAQGIREEKDFLRIIGKSKRMKEVFNLIDKVAQTESTVLIIGDSGTGKELVANAIHERSERKEKKFIAVDCGTLSGNLLASDLFGYVKGAFTGADRDKKGLFESADGGTIFLDEIGNISMDVQAKLLRVLQEQTFLPLGGNQEKKVDVRLIFATNSDLKKLVGEGSFREDLYYRLYVFPIILPRLKERKEDIPSLAYRFLDKFNAKNKRKIKRISDKVLSILIDYDWPGNVRQLENTIERMSILCESESIEVKHVPSNIYTGDSVNQKIPENSEELKKVKKEIRERSVENLERAFILKALEENKWNVTKASEKVNMQRTNFQALMKKYNINIRGH